MYICSVTSDLFVSSFIVNYLDFTLLYYNISRRNHLFVGGRFMMGFFVLWLLLMLWRWLITG